jgi:ABC-type spermidine/putrescine transport system permease subunit II
VTAVLGKAAQVVVVGVISVFLLAPIVLVFVLSFSDDPFISFPPQSWGVEQYRTMASSDIWTAPIVRSVVIGIVVATVVTVIGVPAVIAVARSRLPGRALVQAIAIGPLIVPGVVYAIGAYQVFADLGLVGTRIAFVLAHTVLAVPLVLLIVGAAATRVPRELELAAMSLGAGRSRAIWDVTLRLLTPAILAGALFAFSLSLNEVVVSNFLADIYFTTLPVAIFASLRIAVEPVIMAISASLAVLSGIVMTLAFLLRRRVR